jgi:histidyl-tRNA synthetase
MKSIISAVKGTRDFYPDDMSMRTWLYNKMRKVSESFGYQEYEGPILESLDLYAAKSGDELVKEQSFVFSDRGGDLITLRPELTPTLTRMVAQRQNQLVFPLRWWSFGPFWRYERPQKGRTREFFQWNVDLLGIDTPEGDAEIVALVAKFFQEVGLTPEDVTILVNNRRLMDQELVSIGIPLEMKMAVSNLIDRRNKMTPEAWKAYATETGLNNQQFEKLVEILDDPELWKKSDEMPRFFKAIQAQGVGNYVRYDANIVRGLLYYTGTVFEAYDVKGDIRRSILGGGRYDNLTADVGGDPVPGVGFAMGDVIITLLLRNLGLIPNDLSNPTAPILVTVFDQERLIDSFALASELRSYGLKVVCFPDATKLGKQMKFADRMGIKIAIVLGPDELIQNTVTIKNLSKSEQVTVLRPEAPDFLRKLLIF